MIVRGDRIGGLAAPELVGRELGAVGSSPSKYGGYSVAIGVGSSSVSSSSSWYLEVGGGLGDILHRARLRDEIM